MTFHLVELLLIVFAFVLVLFEAFRLPGKPWLSFGWLGLACWLFSLLLVTGRA